MCFKQPFNVSLVPQVLLWVLISVPAQAQTDGGTLLRWDSYLPPGDGRKSVETLCQSCHDLGVVITRRKNRGAWQGTVNRMLPADYLENLGDDIKILTRYLAEYFGPLIPPYETLSNNSELRAKYLAGEIKSLVNINVGLLDELTGLPGFDKQIAESIIEYRKAHGPFKSIEDLKSVKLIDEKALDEVRAFLTVD